MHAAAVGCLQDIKNVTGGEAIIDGVRQQPFLVGSRRLSTGYL